MLYSLQIVNKREIPMIDSEDNDFVDSTEIDEIEYFGSRELRWYQVAARNQVAVELERGVKRILIELPTGAGKTLTIACTLSNPRIRKSLNITNNRKMRVLFVAHKHRLLTQAEQTFVDASDVELIPMSMFANISPELMEKGWDITVLDESHHESCGSFQYQLEKLGNHCIIGLTATPDRHDGMMIKFESIINPISREQCVAEGWLAPTYLNSIVDTPHQDKVPVTKMILDQFGDEFGQTMMFFRTKKEVRAINDYLSKMGKKSMAILEQSNKEVDKILNDFSDGKIQFLVNCGKISEGVDVKGCTHIYLGRQVGSYPLLNQIIGRASRPDSDCHVFELINPLSGSNKDTTTVIGTPERHRLISKRRGEWIEQDFDYVSHATTEFVSSISRGTVSNHVGRR
jgi:superfamily II DNA or RNA helicase